MAERLKLMIMGYARHGKDTVCEMLRDNLGYTFQSSSLAAAQEVIFPVLQGKYNYPSLEACYEDRVNHRAEWHDLIKAYNSPDLTRLARKIYSTCDIYCGIRNREEFLAIRDAKLFDIAIWVDASARLPEEDPSSISVSHLDADFILQNNGTQLSLLRDLLKLMTLIESIGSISS